jgi:hypothetical protein
MLAANLIPMLAAKVIPMLAQMVHLYHQQIHLQIL